MASSKLKPVFTRDQRVLTLVVYADSKGHTTCTVDWKEALAGESVYRQRNLHRAEWPAPINQAEHALWCLVQVAKQLTVTRRPDK
jgi:hypothetical protein